MDSGAAAASEAVKQEDFMPLGDVLRLREFMYSNGFEDSNDAVGPTRESNVSDSDFTNSDDLVNSDEMFEEDRALFVRSLEDCEADYRLIPNFSRHNLPNELDLYAKEPLSPPKSVDAQRSEDAAGGTYGINPEDYHPLEYKILTEHVAVIHKLRALRDAVKALHGFGPPNAVIELIDGNMREIERSRAAASEIVAEAPTVPLAGKI